MVQKEKKGKETKGYGVNCTDASTGKGANSQGAAHIVKSASEGGYGTEHHLESSSSMPESGAQPRKEDIGNKLSFVGTIGAKCAGANTNDGTCCLSSLSHSKINVKENGKTHEWIIDSGASDHMTFDETDISTNKPQIKQGVENANGDVYPVTQTGDVIVTKKILLKDTLVVPSLTTKLISISKLAKELNCSVMMFPNHCVFQDILTKETIAHGTRQGELYYLDADANGKACVVQRAILRNKVWL
jgi:hypothetical protein